MGKLNYTIVADSEETRRFIVVQNARAVAALGGKWFLTQDSEWYTKNPCSVISNEIQNATLHSSS